MGWEGRIGSRLQPGYKINRLKEKKKENITEVSKYKAPGVGRILNPE